MRIKGVEEIESIAKEFKKRELARNGKVLVDFKIASTDLKIILGARTYEVVCEYRTFTLGEWKRQIINIRATDGTVISHRDL